VETPIATTRASVEVSEDIIELLGSPEAVANRMRLALALDRLREGRISQGRFATLLGLDRRQALELMAEHRVSSGPQSIAEAERDRESARQAGGHRERMSIVSDTSPLIVLAKIGQLDLLRLLFAEAWIPGAVSKEIDSGIPNRPEAATIREASWIRVDDGDQKRVDF
jgi:predicted HTH domain antitoxin